MCNSSCRLKNGHVESHHCNLDNIHAIFLPSITVVMTSTCTFAHQTLISLMLTPYMSKTPARHGGGSTREGKDEYLIRDPLCRSEKKICQLSRITSFTSPPLEVTLWQDVSVLWAEVIVTFRYKIRKLEWLMYDCMFPLEHRLPILPKDETVKGAYIFWHLN